MRGRGRTRITAHLLWMLLAACTQPEGDWEARWGALPPAWTRARPLEAPLAHLGTTLAVRHQAASLGLPCRSAVLVFKVTPRPGALGWAHEVRALEQVGFVLGAKTELTGTPYVRAMLIDTQSGNWVVALRRPGDQGVLWGVCATR